MYSYIAIYMHVDKREDCLKLRLVYTISEEGLEPRLMYSIRPRSVVLGLLTTYVHVRLT